MSKEEIVQFLFSELRIEGPVVSFIIVLGIALMFVAASYIVGRVRAARGSNRLYRLK